MFESSIAKPPIGGKFFRWAFVTLSALLFLLGTASAFGPKPSAIEIDQSFDETYIASQAVTLAGIAVAATLSLIALAVAAWFWVDERARRTWWLAAIANAVTVLLMILGQARIAAATRAAGFDVGWF